MLKQKALIDVLGQVNTSDVNGAMLFNKEGLLLAYSGYNDGKCAPNVAAALVAGIWSSMEKRGDLRESIVVLEDGVMAACQVSGMLLAIKASKKVDIGMVRAKLIALAKYLDDPISMISREAI